jgi:hypothetical protein
MCTVVACSDVARLLDASGDQSQWPSIPEIIKFKTFIEFSVIGLNKLKIVEHRKNFFFLISGINLAAP